MTTPLADLTPIITEGTTFKIGGFERTVERVIDHPAGRWARYVGAPVGDHGNSLAYLERAVANGTATLVKKAAA